MKYISVSEFAQRHGISERTARNYCNLGKIEGAYLVGKTWNIPEDAHLPLKKSRAKKVSQLLQVLREQKQMKIKGGIYHRTQIDLTYNSNHIEGSKLSEDQTRLIFETRTINATGGVPVDDIIETVNHFRAIDYVIDVAEDELTEEIIKELHRILKQGTADASLSWFAVGDYKKRANVVGGRETAKPKDVPARMKALLSSYSAVDVITVDDIIDD